MNRKERKKQFFPLRQEEELISQLNVIRKDMDCDGEFRLKEIHEIAIQPHYIITKIPKKSGGTRIISIPETKLAFLQHCLKKLMYKWYKPNDFTYGFIPSRNIVDNAKNHIKKDIIYNIDLKDFFNSISFDVIIEKLIRPPYSFSYRVSKLIGELTTIPQPDGLRILPQGAPSSPIFTNIVCAHLDTRLSTFCKKHNIVYTRYADDLSFSFERELLKKWEKGNLKSIIKEIITTEGFKINQNKTRISFKHQRHDITGLIVNQKVNITRKYLKNLRTELHNWEKDGYIVSSYKFFRNEETKINKNKFVPCPMEKVLLGKVSFIKMVKGENDSTYLKYKERLDTLIKRDTHFFRTLPEIKLEDRNIFTIKSYQLKNKVYNKYQNKADYQWRLIYHRPFQEDEISMIEDCVIVPSYYGLSANFKLKNGKNKFIPLSIYSKLNIGDQINLNKARIQFLSRGKRKIIRIL